MSGTSCAYRRDGISGPTGTARPPEVLPPEVLPPEVLPPESTEDSGGSVSPAVTAESTSEDGSDEPRAGWFARTPLRVKLVAVMLALVSLALIVIGVGERVRPAQLLLGRIDGQLQQRLPVYARELRDTPCENTPISMPSDFLVAMPDAGVRRYRVRPPAPTPRTSCRGCRPVPTMRPSSTSRTPCIGSIRATGGGW